MFTLSVSKTDKKNWSVGATELFYEGHPDLQQIIRWSADQLAPLNGLNCDFYRVDLSGDQFQGCYGPVESVVADAVESLTHRPYYSDLDLTSTIASKFQTSALSSAVPAVVECAYLDGVAKQEEISVAEYISGASVSTTVPCYISLITLNADGKFTPDIAQKASQLGFWGQKWDLPEGPRDGKDGLKRNVQRVQALREAMGDNNLILELHRNWEADYLIEFLKQVESCDVTMIEDPFPVDDLQSYQKLGASIKPVIVGEKFTTPNAFLDYQSEGYVFQTDVVACGGITNVKKIQTLAKQTDRLLMHHGRRMIPAFHIASSTPNSQEVIEFNPIFEPERQTAMGICQIPKNGSLSFTPSQWSGLWPK